MPLHTSSSDKYFYTYVLWQIAADENTDSKRTISKKFKFFVTLSSHKLFIIFYIFVCIFFLSIIKFSNVLVKYCIHMYIKNFITTGKHNTIVIF